MENSIDQIPDEDLRTAWPVLMRLRLELQRRSRRHDLAACETTMAVVRAEWNRRGLIG